MNNKLWKKLIRTLIEDVKLYIEERADGLMEKWVPYRPVIGSWQVLLLENNVRYLLGAALEHMRARVLVQLNDNTFACVRFPELAYTRGPYLTNIARSFLVAAPLGI